VLPFKYFLPASPDSEITRILLSLFVGHFAELAGFKRSINHLFIAVDVQKLSPYATAHAAEQGKLVAASASVVSQQQLSVNVDFLKHIFELS